VAEETPVPAPAEAPPAESAPAEPAESSEPLPLDQVSLSDFVKRRAKGESAQPAPAEETDGEPSPEADEKPSKSGGKAVPKTRFDQVYRQRSDAIRERDAEKARAAQLEQELQQLRGQRQAQEPPPAAQPAQADVAPNLDQYLAAGKTYEDWMDARIQWQAQKIADARIEAVQQRYVQQTAEQQRITEISGLGERTEAAKAKYPDYEQVVIQNNEVRLSPVMAEIAARSKHGPDIMYWLGTHKTEADQLGELTRNYGPASYPLVEQHLLLLSGQLHTSTGAKKAVPISQAPAPISPVGGGSSTSTVSLDQMSLGDYVKRRNAIVEKKRTG